MQNERTLVTKAMLTHVPRMRETYGANTTGDKSCLSTCHSVPCQKSYELCAYAGGRFS
jgi:hypothetical protein